MKEQEGVRVRGRTMLLLKCCLVCLLTGLASCFAGCTTHAKRLRSPRAAFYAGDLQTANSQLQKLVEKPKSDASVIELDLAMTDFFQGNLQNAEQRFRNVRDKWDAAEKKSLAEATASYVSDDRIRAYAGEDYERLLVRVWLTFCSLMQDGVDAESYSLQTLDKQLQLLSRAREKWDPELAEDYCIPPIAPYLRGILREGTHHEYAEAARYYRQTESLLPDALFLREDITRAEKGVHSARGNGVVYLIAMVGRGPYKVEKNAEVTQAILRAADLALSAIGDYSVPPTLAPVRVPQLESPPKPFDLIGVEVNGVPTSTTLPITDLHRLASESYEAKLKDIIVRSVVRRVVKKGAVYAAKDELNVNSDIASLALDAAGVLWEATETADTRCWGLLPREIQILRLELPAGQHRLHLEPIIAGKPVANGIDANAEIHDGRNTFVLSYWPDMEPIGNVLVSSPH